MKDFKNYFKKEKWIKGLIFSLSIILISFPLYGESIREVTQNIERVKSIGSTLQFAVIGDSRDGEKVYIQFMQMILGRKPDFIIHLGDMISRPNEKEWDAFFELSKSILIPFFPVVGNHDVGDTLRGEEMYKKRFSLPDGKTYYSFRTWNGLYIILDSERGKGRIADQQRLWLENILSSSNEKWKFLFIHRPFFPPVDSFKLGRGIDQYPNERDDLHRLFIKTRVKTVFTACDHRYNRMIKDGLFYLISGGGGAPLGAFEESGGYFHYIWVSVKNGRMECETVDLKGQIRDQFVIE